MVLLPPFPATSGQTPSRFTHRHHSKATKVSQPRSIRVPRGAPSC